MTTESASVISIHFAQLGRQLAAQRVRELAGDALDQGAVTRIFGQQGCPVRAVAATPDVLRNLTLPTLLTRRDGALAILEHVDDAEAVVREADDCPRRVSLRALGETLACAFERLPVDDAGDRWLPVLFDRVTSQRGELWLLGLTILALAGMGPLISWLTRAAVAGALGERSASLLSTLVVALSLTAVLRAWLSWLRARASIAMEARVVRSVGPVALKRLLGSPYSVQEARGFANQWAALTSAELAARGMTTLLIDPAVEACTMVGYLATLFAHRASVAGVLASGALVTIAGAYLLARWQTSADVEAVREAAVARERLNDLVQGIATIKSEHAERAMLFRWVEALLRERGVCLTRELRESWLSLWLLASEHALRLFVVCSGAWSVVDGKETLPDFLYLLLLTEGLLASLALACHLLFLVLAVRAHAARADTLLAGGPAPGRVDAIARAADVDDLVVRMHDVWFRHAPDQPWILQGYDLTVKAGEHLVLRGASGAGKTTILRLLAGFYRPERGTVAVCGRDPARDRREVRYLPQQARLFAGSLRDNLEQLSGASLEVVMKAAERTGMTRWLATLPMGLETVITTQGDNLSGGQRQWVLLTAAVASSQRLVLLDEATSQVDHLLRRQLQVPALFAGRTTISVLHD